MTSERRQALEALCQGATAGPWRVIGVAGGCLVELPLANKEYPEGKIRWCPSLTYEHRDTEPGNAAFIAEARTAIPEALAEIARLTERWEALKKWLKLRRIPIGSDPIDADDDTADYEMSLVQTEMARLERDPSGTQNRRGSVMAKCEYCDGTGHQQR